LKKSEKQIALLRDLARFVAKYKASDLQAALKALTAAQANRPEKAKRASGESAPRKRKSPKTSVKAKAVPKKRTVSKARRRQRRGPSEKSSEHEASIDVLLWQMPPRQLRFTYSRLFHEKQAPEDRQQVISELYEHISKLPEAARLETIAALVSRDDDATENYKRWLNIISRTDKGQ
jgi:hypothetical protein